jgi:hypothetical protein
MQREYASDAAYLSVALALLLGVELEVGPTSAA